MPGLDLTQISGNWKKLRAQISPQKQKDGNQNGTAPKRKRDASLDAVRGPHSKRPRKVFAPLAPRRRLAAKMGNTFSTPTTQPPAPNERNADLQRKFDLSSTDLDVAYGGRAELRFEDEVNGGRHAAHKVGRYLALDCEMVGTGPPPHIDDLLARVSIVNFHGQQIYDSYVLPMPGCRVEDYRTHVSGIRREHLQPGTARPFAEVQKAVSDLLDGKILVGHALRKDMQVLQLDHPKRDIRDTSRYPPYRVESKGKPPALRHLAKNQLGIHIQKGEHSSIEDARATMMLYKKEKAGFEADNRKQFGVPRQPKTSQPRAERPSQLADDPESDPEEEDYDSDADDALLNGEDDGEALSGNHANGMLQTANGAKRRKKKKKKRTKR